MSVMGFFFSFLGILGIVYIIINKIINNIGIQGWASIMVLILIVSGIQMTMIGIIGEYVWRNLDESKKRPVFIIDEKIGFDNNRNL